MVLFNNLYSYEKFSSYGDIVNWRVAPQNVQVEMKGKVYTHIIDSNQSLDFWTDNPVGDGQEKATEIFTSGDRSKLPVVTHNLIALTKGLGNYNRYTKDGIKSNIDSNFYQWYYLNDPKSTSFVDINSSWLSIGKEGFSSGYASYTKIVLDSEGVPYIIYADEANLKKATVKKYNKSSDSWVAVGEENFSKDNADCPSIAMNSKNIPYVIYRDKGENNKVIVKKYNQDNNKWENVGEGVISNINAYYTQIVIDTNDIPYIVYRDQGTGYRITVKRFNGTTWELVGKEGFSKESSDFTEIALDNENIPYVIYRDKANLYKATVQKYNESIGSWEFVGGEGFSDGDVYNTAIAFDSKNVPYVVYRDTLYGSKAIVKKYNKNSNKWENLGQGDISKDSVDYLDITIDKYDIAYITYRDKGEGLKGIVKRYNKYNDNWEEWNDP